MSLNQNNQQLPNNKYQENGAAKGNQEHDRHGTQETAWPAPNDARDSNQLYGNDEAYEII